MQRFVTYLIIGTLGTVFADHGTPARAQDSSLFNRRPQRVDQAPLRWEDVSFYHVRMPPPKELRKHDIINIRVDEMARMKSEGEVERRKNALLDAVLSDWVILNGLKSVKPSPQSDGDPSIAGSVTKTYRAEGGVESQESLSFNMAAHVADIRPNGNLVLEGHKRIRINEESWEFSLSGICRREDIGPDNTVLSRNIDDLMLYKRERGVGPDGYRRGWAQRLLDRFQAF